jgi:hypothetical protein
VIEPAWRTNWKDEHALTGIKVARLTQARPGKPNGAVIKLKVRIPDAVFAPFAPEVTIDVPEHAVHYEPVVTVELPGEPDDA